MVICPGFKDATERLARAGFMAVSFDFPSLPVLRDLEIVMEALMRGEWGVVPSALGLLGHSMGSPIVVQRAASDPQVRALVTWATAAGSPPPPDVVSAGQVRAPWLIVRGDTDEQALELAMNATVDWFAKHLA